MKLLREFFRLRASRALASRRADSRRSWTITVPAPLGEAQGSPSSDMHRSSESVRGRHAVRRQETAVSQAHRHLQLVSSL